jgi:Cft2 family RNA processing exonuclease
MKGHARVIATPATAAMMRLRGAGASRFREVDFGHPFHFHTADDDCADCGEACGPDCGDSRTRATLLPAGHVLGSSQVLVERDGLRLLYSGDFKLRPSRASEEATVPAADILVMETTFGRPQYKFPETEEVLGDIRRWCSAVLRTGGTPVLFCYSLGKGQEVLAGLDGVDFPIYLHEKHFAMANLYRQFGVAMPEYRLYQPETKIDGVLCAPAAAAKAAGSAGSSARTV